jgi:hypothetical protein
MFRLIIWGESFIILGMALLAYIMIQDSGKLKESLLGKLIVISLLLMSVVIFLLSFDNIRLFFAGTFL